MRRWAAVVVVGLAVACRAHALEDFAPPPGGDFYGLGGIAVGRGEAEGVVAVREGVPPVQRTELTLERSWFKLEDGADRGVSRKLYTFPKGRIYVLGAVVSATVTNSAGFEASVNDVWLGAVGTEGTTNATLTGAKGDIIAATTFDTVSDSVGWHRWEATMVAGGNSVYDGRVEPLALYWNAGAADASISTNHVYCGVLGGELTLFWINLGGE